MRRLPFVIVYLVILIFLFFISKRNTAGSQIKEKSEIEINVLTANTLRGVDVGNEQSFDSLRNSKRIEPSKHVSGKISESENLFGDFSEY